jgi:hypothetical protein
MSKIAAIQDSSDLLKYTFRLSRDPPTSAGGNYYAKIYWHFGDDAFPDQHHNFDLLMDASENDPLEGDMLGVQKDAAITDPWNLPHNVVGDSVQLKYQASVGNDSGSEIGYGATALNLTVEHTFSGPGWYTVHAYLSDHWQSGGDDSHLGYRHYVYRQRMYIGGLTIGWIRNDCRVDDDEHPGAYDDINHESALVLFYELNDAAPGQGGYSPAWGNGINTPWRAMLSPPTPSSAGFGTNNPQIARNIGPSSHIDFQSVRLRHESSYRSFFDPSKYPPVVVERSSLNPSSGFSPWSSSETYSVGDFVYYDSSWAKDWVCISAHSSTSSSHPSAAYINPNTTAWAPAPWGGQIGAEWEMGVHWDMEDLDGAYASATINEKPVTIRVRPVDPVALPWQSAPPAPYEHYQRQDAEGNTQNHLGIDPAFEYIDLYTNMENIGWGRDPATLIWEIYIEDGISFSSPVSPGFRGYLLRYVNGVPIWDNPVS